LIVENAFQGVFNIAIRMPLSRIRLNCGRILKSGTFCQKQLAPRHLDVLSGNVVFKWLPFSMAYSHRK
jgi:hypothetical protein